MQLKKRKYRKSFKGRGWEGRSHRKPDGRTQLQQGDYGLRSREGGRRSARQLEAGRRGRRNRRKRAGKVWVKVFTDVPVTKKLREVRMGNGKGSVEFWAVHVKEGTMRYEVSGVEEGRAREALQKAGDKRLVRTKVVKR